MLVRRRVEDDVGLFAREHRLDERHVLDVADDRHDRQLRERVGERRLDLVERRLGHVEQHEPRGTKARDLAASSAPIEPPAPVTMTTRLPSHSARPALSSTTGSRDSRSSTSTLRSVVSASRPEMRSSYDGTVSASTPAAAHSSATRRRTTWLVDGSAMITLRTP